MDQRSTPAPPSACPQILTSHLLGNQTHCDASQARGWQGLPASHCQVLASWMPLSSVVLLEMTPATLIHCGKIRLDASLVCVTSSICIAALQMCIHRSLWEWRRNRILWRGWDRNFWVFTASRSCYLLVNVDSGFEFYRVVFMHRLRHTTVSFCTCCDTGEKSSNPHLLLANLF